MKLLYTFVSNLFFLITPIYFKLRISNNKEHPTRFKEKLSITKIKRSNGRVICEKDRIIPPALDGSTPSYYFGPTYSGGRNQKIHNLPIMVLSANITPNVSERLRTYNVNAIVEKPFDMDELVGHVNRLIKSPY